MKHNEIGRRTVRLAAGGLLSVAILFFMGCFYMPGLSGRGVARARAIVNPLPSNVASIALVVGGPGMDTVVTTYAVGTTTATLTVPSGPGRTFTLLANTPSVTMRADSTVDLAPGETKDITLNPVLSTTQIVVPDEYTGRLVQIGDMNGTGWTALSVSSPYQVDFDAKGRIYLASYGSGISVMDDISGANSAPFPTSTQYAYSLAMDRARGILYYLGYDGNFAFHLWSFNLGTGAETDLTPTVFPSGLYGYGVAVDSDGLVYVATINPSAAVVKIDPTVPKVVTTYTNGLTAPFDVMVRGDYVYVSDQGQYYSNIPGKVVRLTKSLGFVDDFGGPADSPFYGPERFVAVLNKPITVIDEAQNAQQDRLVSFDDMTGAGWTVYGSEGSGTGQWMFFSYGGSG